MDPAVLVRHIEYARGIANRSRTHSAEWRSLVADFLEFERRQWGALAVGLYHWDEEIQTFCRTVYGVRFPVFAKIEVNGDGAHPLYKYLKKAAPGLAGTENVKWNFTKFLVAQDGTVVRRFASATKPRDLVSHIDDQLAE